MDYAATLVKHPPEDNEKNDSFLVGPLVPMRINWLPMKFSVLNFGKQSVKLILVFFVTIVYLFVLFLIKIFYSLTCKSAAWVWHKGPLKGHRVSGYRNLSQYVLGNSKFFCFLPEMVKSSPKELFKIARCFRSYYESLFESFQKVTERSRMMVTIQTRIQ